MRSIGSGFKYHTNQHLKATPFFTPADKVKPKLVYNQFGGYRQAVRSSGTIILLR